MDPLVELRDVHKSFGRTEVLHGIDMDVPAGRITGLLGPSGHGKTTLVSLIVGVLAATSGEIHVLGEPAPPRKVKSSIGYMPQSDALYDDLTAGQNLRFFGSLYGLSRAELAQGIPRALDMVSLDIGDDRKTVGAFSGGMKRRLSLAVALLHSPRLLVLDEPTVGLDPVHRVKLWASFRELASAGRTLLITTHVMDEAANCDEVILIHDGQVIARGTPSDLVERTGAKDLEAAFLDFEAQAETVRPAVRHLSGKPSRSTHGAAKHAIVDEPISESVPPKENLTESVTEGTVPFCHTDANVDATGVTPQELPTPTKNSETPGGAVPEDSTPTTPTPEDVTKGTDVTEGVTEGDVTEGTVPFCHTDVNVDATGVTPQELPTPTKNSETPGGAIPEDSTPTTPAPENPTPPAPILVNPIPTEPVFGDPTPSTPTPSIPIPSTPTPSTPIPSALTPTNPVPADPVPIEPIPAARTPGDQSEPSGKEGDHA